MFLSIKAKQLIYEMKCSKNYDIMLWNVEVKLSKEKHIQR